MFIFFKLNTLLTKACKELLIAIVALAELNNLKERGFPPMEYLVP